MDYNSSKPSNNGGKGKNSTNSDQNVENNQWDGSDNKFVRDADATEFEDKYSGIKLDYKLNKDEIIELLGVTQNIRKRNKRNIIKTVILAILFVAFIVLYFAYNKSVTNIIMALLCLLFTAIMWFVPLILFRKETEYMIANDTEYSIEIYPDEISVCEKKKGVNPLNWTFPMNETSELYESESMIILNTKSKGFLGIPIRVVEPGVLADLKGILFTGTTPVDED